jgi:hypothetical protein
MIHRLIRATLGVSIAVGCLAMATPASATVFKNFKNEAKCLGVTASNITPGTGLIIWDCDGTPNQNWNAQGFSGSYDQLWDSAAPAPPNSNAQCMALGNNGNTNDGQQLVIWNCNAGTHDQGWQLVFTGTDASGHSCYNLKNEKAAEQGHNRVAAVGNNGNMTNGQSVVIWDFVGSSDQYWCAY